MTQPISLPGLAVTTDLPENGLVPEPRLCVQCRERPASQAWKPFCSERCKLLDLGRWLQGTYRVPGEPEETEDDDGDDGVNDDG